MTSSTEEPIQELILPGVVEETPSSKPAGGKSVTEDDEAQTDDENLDDIKETLSERLYGLTEMFPPHLVSLCTRGWSFSYWFLRRSMWVVGTSLALLVLPPFIEQQRIEFEEMQNMQKKQLMLGQGATMPQQPLTLPPTQR